MDNFFLLLMLASLVCFLIGIIRPSTFKFVLKNKAIRRYVLPITLFAIILFFILFGVTLESTSTQKVTSPSQEVSSENQTQEIQYEVISENTMGKVKYQTTLRIQKELSEDEIKRIFYKIKNENSNYERYFVSFLLPGMEKGSGSWAMASETDGSLEISIHGLTIAQKDKAIEKDYSNALGVWLDNVFGMVHQIILEENDYYLIIDFPEGVSTKIIVLQQDINKFIVPDSSAGDYYLIVDDVLEVWDNEGKIDTYKSLK